MIATPSAGNSRSSSGKFRYSRSLSSLHAVLGGGVMRRLVLAAPSSPLELCASLLEEGVHPLLHILGRCEDPEEVRFEGEGVIEGSIEAMVDCLDGEGQCDRPIPDDSPEEFFRSLRQLGLWDDPVNESDPVCLLCIDHLAGQDQLEGAASADESWESDRSAITGYDPELDLRECEARILTCDPDIGGEREFESSAEGEAIDSCDDGLWHLLEEPEDPLSQSGGLDP